MCSIIRHCDKANAEDDQSNTQVYSTGIFGGALFVVTATTFARRTGMKLSASEQEKGAEPDPRR